MSTKESILTPPEILAMQVFLSRVISTAPTAIKVTGNPATDENTDLLTARVSHEDKAGGAFYATLDKIEAGKILCFLEGWTDTLPDGTPDIKRGTATYAQFVSRPAILDPC